MDQQVDRLVLARLDQIGEIDPLGLTEIANGHHHGSHLGLVQQVQVPHLLARPTPLALDPHLELVGLAGVPDRLPPEIDQLPAVVGVGGGQALAGGLGAGRGGRPVEPVGNLDPIGLGVEAGDGVLPRPGGQLGLRPSLIIRVHHRLGGVGMETSTTGSARIGRSTQAWRLPATDHRRSAIRPGHRLEDLGPTVGLEPSHDLVAVGSVSGRSGSRRSGRQ